jgi:hypothetical protein
VTWLNEPQMRSHWLFPHSVDHTYRIKNLFRSVSKVELTVSSAFSASIQ